MLQKAFAKKVDSQS